MAEPLSASGAEADTLQQLYRREIERVMVELDSLLARLHKRMDTTTVANARDTFSVLRSCYLEGALSIPALDVLLQHFLTLAGMFKQQLN